MPENREPRRPSHDTEPHHPRQSEVNRSGMSREEAASRAQATRSGRAAAKWFGIALVGLIAIIVLAGLFGGGGTRIWGSGDTEAVVEEVD